MEEYDSLLKEMAVGELFSIAERVCLEKKKGVVSQKTRDYKSFGGLDTLVGLTYRRKQGEEDQHEIENGGRGGVCGVGKLGEDGYSDQSF